MKKGFIRGLWGIFDRSHRITGRRFRVENNIINLLKNKNNTDFRTYVFGKENYDGLIKMGVKDVVLINEAPSQFDLIKHQYRHKLELIKYAMEVDNYDELVYMDWDCSPTKSLYKNFWQELGKKEVVQANLIIYRRKKAFWRKEELRKVPNGGFIYLRDKTIPQKVIDIWNTMKQDNDEPAWAKFTDDMVGGWQGAHKYWELFEPMFCNLRGSAPYPKELMETKTDVCFLHNQGRGF